MNIILGILYNEYMKQEYRENYIRLGLNIAYYRKLNGLTQEQLADRINVDYSHISKMELATVGISLDKLFDIANALGIPPYKLLQFKD